MDEFRYATARRYPIAWAGEQAEIGTIDELMVALDVLNRRHDRALLEQLAPVLAELTRAGDRPPAANVKILLKGLAREERLFVVDALGSRLLPLVGSAIELRNLLVSLADLDVEAAILRSIGDAGLRRVVSTSQQLWEILEWLYGENDVLLLGMLGAPYLRRLVVQGRDLAEIMRRLDPEQQLPTLQMFGWDAAIAVLRDAVDLKELLSALCTPACAALIERLPRARIAELAGNEAGWFEIGRRLSPSKTALLADKMKRGDHAA